MGWVPRLSDPVEQVIDGERFPSDPLAGHWRQAIPIRGVCHGSEP